MDAHSKSKVLWRCRRGMLELDLLLQKYVENHFDQLSERELALLEELLEYPDPLLQAWFSGEEEAEERFHGLVSTIRTRL